VTGLIFDGFASRPVAVAFATTVSSSLGLEVEIFDTEAQARAQHACPVTLKPPIVRVSAAHKQDRQRLRAIVPHFGGAYRGG
jgi:hypothetical protein